MDTGTRHATARGSDGEEALTRSEYVTPVLNKSVDAKGFEYPADLAVFIVTQRKLCTRGKFRSVLLCQFDGPRSVFLYLLHTEARQQ